MTTKVKINANNEVYRIFMQNNGSEVEISDRVTDMNVGAHAGENTIELTFKMSIPNEDFTIEYDMQRRNRRLHGINTDLVISSA